MEHLSSIFLGGNTLKELNFPEDWRYDHDMKRWHSDKHFLTVTPATSERETGSRYGAPFKQPLYLTNEMLSKMGVMAV